MRKVQPVFQNPFETFSPLRHVEHYLFETAIQFGRAKNRREAALVVDEALHQVGLSLEEVTKRSEGGQRQRERTARRVAADQFEVGKIRNQAISTNTMTNEITKSTSLEITGVMGNVSLGK